MQSKSDFTWGNLFQSLWYFLKGERVSYIFWNCINFLSNINKLLVPFVIGLVINFFINYNVGDSLNEFYIYCVIITISSVVTSLVRLIAKKKISGIAIYTKTLVRTKGFEKLLNFSLKWHEKENTGNKIKRIDKGAEGLRKLIQIFNQKLLSFSIMFIGVLGIFAVLNWRFLAFFIIYIGLFILIESYYSKRLFLNTEEKNIAIESASGTYFEGASNILSVKASGTLDELANKIAKKEEITKFYSLKSRDIKNAKSKVLQLENGFGIGVFLLLLGNGIINGLVTAGFIATAFVYFNQISGSFWQISRIFSELIEIKSSVKRAMPIFHTEEEKYFGEEKFKNNWKKISFKDVSFSYKDKINLKKVSLDIFKNNKIGIVGDSGSGKSTLGKLILGLYKINSGNINVDNLDYYKISHENILKKVSSVIQETELFNSSLLENITMLKKVDKILLEKSIGIAQLDSVIKKLPEGINALLGEKGYKLSGGEKQRIGIARAIYQNSDILILDEATSALDSKTELKIQKGIESLKNKTILIIAHRLSTLKNVDKIIVFDNGEIVEQGNLEELIQDKKSKFYKLWNMQKKSK